MTATMLKAIELPARVADLTACLANMDRDAPDGNFQSEYKMSVKESCITYSRMVLRVKWFKKPPSQSSKGLFQRPKTTELGDREVAVRWVGRGPPACCRHPPTHLVAHSHLAKIQALGQVKSAPPFVSPFVE